MKQTIALDKLPPKIREVAHDKELGFLFCRESVTLPDGYKSSPVYFFKHKKSGSNVGISEELDEAVGNKPIYAVSYSAAFGKDMTGKVRERTLSILNKYLGEPLYEMKGERCDFIIYERPFSA